MAAAARPDRAADCMSWLGGGDIVGFLFGIGINTEIPPRGAPQSRAVRGV